MYRNDESRDMGRPAPGGHGSRGRVPLTVPPEPEKGVPGVGACGKGMGKEGPENVLEGVPEVRSLVSFDPLQGEGNPERWEFRRKGVGK